MLMNVDRTALELVLLVFQASLLRIDHKVSVTSYNIVKMIKEQYTSKTQQLKLLGVINFPITNKQMSIYLFRDVPFY